ncbi:MAG TPA: hypothetical protein VJM46_01755 [Candidatus Saccharimonadales bacterium]|nr:hypothetical protein [Candidatus Saccharimonadales bacterium]
MYSYCTPTIIKIRTPRPAHNYGDCQLVCYLDSATIADAVSTCAENATTYETYDPEWRHQFAKLVEEFFATNPDGVGSFGNYTPRGRKRRGLRFKQRRLFCLRLGNERHYFPTLSRYSEVTFTRDRVTIRCRCKGVNRSNIPLTTELWPAPTAS